MQSSEAGLGGKIVDGLNNCSGDVVTFLEDDDCYERDRLEFVEESFGDPGLTYLQNGFTVIDAQGAPYQGRFPHDAQMRHWTRLGSVSVPGRPTRESLRTWHGFQLVSTIVRFQSGDPFWLMRTDCSSGAI